MNELMNKAKPGNLPAVRTIPEIEADILAQKRTIGASIVFIGRALIEAKAQLSHGEWGRWLSERVDFSASSAENYMRIAREFGEDSRLLSLPYSKVLALLPVPAQERETFASANNVEDKSVAEIKRLVKERDEAERKAIDYQVKLKSESAALRNAMARAANLEEELKSRPNIVKEIEVAPEDYKKVMAERHEMEGRVIKAQEEVERVIMERNEMLSQMAREISNAEEERDAALAELEAEKLAGGVQDPLDVTQFCDACSALLNKLYAAPYAKPMLMTKTDVELKRYEMNVRLVMEWAVKVQDVIDTVQAERFGEECVFSIM